MFRWCPRRQKNRVSLLDGDDQDQTSRRSDSYNARRESQAHEFSQAVTERLLQRLRNNDPSLRQLSIRVKSDNKSTCIRHEEAVRLADALSESTHLTRLNLSENVLGNRGVEALAEGLRTNQALLGLSLTFNNFGLGGASALGELLRTNTTLENLDVGHNGIRNDGAVALAEGLKENATVTNLSLCCCFSVMKELLQ